MTPALTIVSIGEPMIELARSPQGPLSYDRRYGGDTLNTAVYLARLLKPETARIHYVTRLGDDPLSDWMIKGFASEGIDCSLIARVKDRRPGLYIIDTDERGERSFSYWRSEAPARQLFEESDLAEQLSSADAIYTSGITLAILSEEGRERQDRHGPGERQREDAAHPSPGARAVPGAPLGRRALPCPRRCGKPPQAVARKPAAIGP